MSFGLSLGERTPKNIARLCRFARRARMIDRLQPISLDGLVRLAGAARAWRADLAAIVPANTGPRLDKPSRIPYPETGAVHSKTTGAR